MDNDYIAFIMTHHQNLQKSNNIQISNFISNIPKSNNHTKTNNIVNTNNNKLINNFGGKEILVENLVGKVFFFFFTFFTNILIEEKIFPFLKKKKLKNYFLIIFL
jgi:hypothetical protein